MIDTIFDLNYWKDNYCVKSDIKMNRYLIFIYNIYKLGKRNINYCEHHHIIPKCFNSDINLIIDLTPREHYIAHLILSKCFYGINNSKMIYAFMRMCYSKNPGHYVPSSRVYENLRKELSINMSQKMKGNSIMRGRKFSEESRKRVSIASSNRKHSEETKMKISNSNKGKRLGKISSEETRKKISNSLKGKNNPMYGVECPVKDKICITNGIINKFIFENELDQYIKDGYHKGKTVFNPKNTKGYIPKNYNKICVNDGIINKYINKQELDNYISNGWKVGMITKRRRN